MMQNKSGLAYMGVNALNPPDVTYSQRPPTTNDYIGYNLMHLWHVITPTPSMYQLWYLADKSAGIATWLQLYPGAGGSGGNLRSDDALISLPDAYNAINVIGGEAYVPGTDPYINIPAYVNIFTAQYPDTNSVTVVLKRSLRQPPTTADATEGMYSLGGSDFLYAYGQDSTMCGIDAGNRTFDPVLTTANTCIGHEALHSIQTGASRNTGCGDGALADLLLGTDCIGIGYDAGVNYNMAESSCIVIGSGGVTGDANCIRLGKMGVGLGEADKIYVAGVWNGVGVPGKDTGLVVVNEDGKLYVDNIDPNCCLMTNAAGDTVGVKGAVGTILTGQGAAPGDPTPAFLAPYSPDLSVIISTDPVTNQLTFTAAPAGGGVAKFSTDDSLVVLPDTAHNINVFGEIGGILHSTGSIANTIVLGLDHAANGKILAGNGVGSPAIWKTLQSHDGSIIFNYGTAGVIDMIAVGGGGGGTITNLLADTVYNPATPILGAITISGGLNIRTTCNTGIVEVNVTDNVNLAGYLKANGDVETVTGNVRIDAGDLLLPKTTSTTSGNIKVGGTTWMHSYGDPATISSNMFLGFDSGNTTLNPALSFNNTSCGIASSRSLTSGQRNCAYGVSSLMNNKTGSQNSCYGEGSLMSSTDNSYNICIGYHSGYYLQGNLSNSNILIGHDGVNNESNAIRIGRQGVGSRQQDKCYISGIYSATADTSPKMVVIGSNHKLSTQAIPTGVVSTYGTDSGNATPSGGTLNISGGYNVATRGSGDTVTIDVDASIQQGNTTSAGEGIYALGTRGAVNYTTNRFMHNYGTSATYLGRQAGPISGAGGTNCVGIGANALDAANGMQSSVAIGKESMTNATNSNYCTCVGALSGKNLTAAANNNVLIGYNAGLNYDTEVDNIILGGSGGSNGGDSSAPFDTSTMRLGYKTVWDYVTDPRNQDGKFTEITQGTRSTYIYGIYNSALDSSALPMYVDRYGKVGTSGNVMFAYRQTTSIANATGDGTVYNFGTAGGITIDFDNTTSLSYDGLNRLIFTAPYAGKYCFMGAVTMSIPASPVVPRPVSVDPVWLVTSQLDYCFATYIPASTTTAQFVSEVVTAIVYLDRGDTARFACAVGQKTNPKNITISNTVGGMPYVPSGVSSANGTHFFGFRIG